MTGAEFFDRLYANGAFIDDSGAASRVIIREFDAAVASLTAERDRLALDFANCADVGRRLESQLAALTAERDAALEDAARADAAAMFERAERLVDRIGGFESEVARLREENAALTSRIGALDLANDFMFSHECPTGRAAAEYVSALEAEHEAATVLQAVDYRDAIAANREWVSAHAAVEALRTVKP